MTTYTLTLMDTTSTAIVPGFNDGIYESDTPIPVPSRGDVVESLGRQWTVQRALYRYGLDRSNNLRVNVTVECTPLRP